ncbi:hypothetical protein EON65_03910 [archaeon]|nr:MAG: hypothetical protein EON65_03910 [archaeon]
MLGTALIFTSLNALEGVIMSLLAKIISPELAQGTFNSGLLATEAGTFGRVVGDMLITMWGEQSQAGVLVNELFLPLGACLLGTVALVYQCYDRLID